MTKMEIMLQSTSAKLHFVFLSDTIQKGSQMVSYAPLALTIFFNLEIAICQLLGPGPRGTYGVHTLISSQIEWGKWPFLPRVCLPYKKVAQKRPPKLTLQDLKYRPEVRVELETCSIICRTPLQAILDKTFPKAQRTRGLSSAYQSNLF